MTKPKRMPVCFYLQEEDVTKLKICLEEQNKLMLSHSKGENGSKLTLSSMAQMAIDELYWSYVVNKNKKIDN